jgi:hypothetical protein
VHLGGLLLLGGLTALAMVVNYRLDPFDPALEGTRRYGHNYAGALGTGLLFVGIELAVLIAVLRPWSYCRSWVRSLGGLVLLVPWTLISLVLSMHSGGVILLHGMWLLLLVVVLTVGLVWSGIAAARARR